MTDWQAQIDEYYRVMDKVESNVVWEILRQSEKFFEWQHYPKGDVYDKASHSQYYYHAHPQDNGKRWPEHGHFHLFIRQKGIPEACQPLPGQEKCDDICHIGAISMDRYGKPMRLFTTNRWVTGETWYPAAAVCDMLDYFEIDHSWPSWPTNLWLNAMVKLYKDDLKRLFVERDQAIEDWRAKHPDVDVFEDRALEVTSVFDIPTYIPIVEEEAATETEAAAS